MFGKPIIFSFSTFSKSNINIKQYKNIKIK